MNKQDAIRILGETKLCSPLGQACFVGIEALEKQIPKKAILSNGNRYGDIEDVKLLCPNCEEDLWDIKDCGFSGCPYCLQAIDWSGEDE